MSWITPKRDEERVDVAAGESAIMRFAEPGASCAGFVLWYDRDQGSTDYDDNPCGVLVLQQKEGGQIWIRLTSTVLARAVADAAKESREKFGNDGFKLARVEYTHEQKSTKSRFKYKCYECQYWDPTGIKIPELEQLKPPGAGHWDLPGETRYEPDEGEQNREIDIDDLPF